jgi:two-component system cell cycle response regulator
MNENILIIDDNPLNIELFAYLLGAFGYGVRTALSGPEGLELARNAAPDLIICDVVMPGMDGYQVVRHLRADPELANVPIIAVTALAMVDDQSKMLQNGFDGYISKPIDPRAFVREIATFLADTASNQYAGQSVACKS